MENRIQRDTCVKFGPESGARDCGRDMEATGAGQSDLTPENNRRRGPADRRRFRRGGRRASDLASAGLLLALMSLLTSSTAQAQTRDLLIPPGSDTAWHGVYLPYTTTITSTEIT